MVGAAAAVHNFLRLHEPLDDLEEDEEYDVEGHAYLAETGEGEIGEQLPAVNAAEKHRADARRERIAQAMWNLYVLEHEDLE